MSTLENLNAGSFALTFLDYDRYKEMMRNDELAIDKVGGRIFYKNKEGHYFSMDTSTRVEQFINSIRRDFRERGNLGTYDVFTFDLPVFKLDPNLLSINGENEPLYLQNVDLKDATVTIYLDIVKPIDMNTGIITSTFMGDGEYSVNIRSNDNNMVNKTFKSGKAFLLSDVIDFGEEDRSLAFTDFTMLSGLEDAYLMGVYIVVSHDFNTGEEASRPWTWDGRVRWDGTHTFY